MRGWAMRIDAGDAEMLSVTDLAALTALVEEHRPRLRGMLHARIDPSLAGRLDVDDLLQRDLPPRPPVLAPRSPPRGCRPMPGSIGSRGIA